MFRIPAHKNSAQPAAQFHPGLDELHAKCDAQSASPDFRFAPHGSVAIITPLTERARAWLAEYAPDAQRWCGGIAVEARYVKDIVLGVRADGYSFE